jgi:hypothetical protein
MVWTRIVLCEWQPRHGKIVPQASMLLLLRTERRLSYQLGQQKLGEVEYLLGQSAIRQIVYPDETGLTMSSLHALSRRYRPEILVTNENSETVVVGDKR